MSPRLPLSAFYFASFGALGAFLPFAPLLFERRGLRPTEISQIMLLIPICAVIVPSLWGLAADSLRARVPLLRVALLGSAGAVLLVLPAHSYAELLLAMTVFCFFRASLISMGDAQSHAELQGVSFSIVRVYGSIGFAITAWVVGELGASDAPGRMLGATSALYAFGFIAALGMRPTPVEPRPKVIGRAFAHVRQSRLPLLFAGTCAHYVGQSMFDVYFGLHMRALGHDDAFVGLGWSVGVVCEIGLMFYAGRLLARFDARRFLVLATVAAIVRWSVLSVAETKALILAAQSLHALTFGLWYLSMVKFVQDEAPEDLRTAIQSFAVTSMGAGMLIGYLLGGVLFEQSGGALVFQTGAVAAVVATAFYGFLAR